MKLPWKIKNWIARGLLVFIGRVFRHKKSIEAHKKLVREMESTK